ncbi:putative Ulp1 protease family catalytic domain, papain-like cysteine peptidase superfamily [Plasmopara halstedii]
MQQTQACLDEWRYKHRLQDAACFSRDLQREFPLDLQKPPLAAQAFNTRFAVRQDASWSGSDQLSLDKFRRRLEEYNCEEYGPSPKKKQKIIFEKVDHVREQIKSNQDLLRRLQSKLRGEKDRVRTKSMFMDRINPIVGHHKPFERSKMDKLETTKSPDEEKNKSVEPGNGDDENLEKQSTIDNNCNKNEESIVAKSRNEEIAALEDNLRSQHLSRTSKADELFYARLASRESNTILEEVLIESLYDIVPNVFKQEVENSRHKELPPELLQIVENALHEGSIEEVLVEKYNVTITRRHLQCLLPTTWLNDEVINFYLQMMSERDEELVKAGHLAKRSHFFNSFFYTKVSENGYNYINVRRWTRKIDVFAMDKIFFPINVANMHWCMAVIFMTEKRIQYYDSMHGSGASCLKVLLRYLHDESEHKRKEKFNDEGWELVTTTFDTPQQKNGSDCGVFSCMFADYLSLNKPLSFVQKDIPFHRHRMVLHVSRGYIPLEEDGL